MQEKCLRITDVTAPPFLGGFIIMHKGLSLAVLGSLRCTLSQLFPVASCAGTAVNLILLTPINITRCRSCYVKHAAGADQLYTYGNSVEKTRGRDGSSSRAADDQWLCWLGSMRGDRQVPGYRDM